MPHRFASLRHSFLDERSEKIVGRLGDDAVSFQQIRGKVAQIQGHDAIGFRMNGCREHVAVVRVGQTNRFDEMFEAFDEAIFNALIDQFESSQNLTFPPRDSS